MKKPRLALVLDKQKEAARWLDGYDVVTLKRDRFLSAELSAVSPDLIVLESVHPSEAGWLLSWVRAQPRLASIPVLILLPFGPPPRRSRGAGFLETPLDKGTLIDEIDRLLGHPTPLPSGRR